MEKSRRQFLVRACMGAVACLAAPVVAQQGGTACYDPASLPLSQKSRRRSLAYTDISGEPGKRCALCAFFTEAEGNCGSCQMLSGGTVSAGGICSSFAAKAS